MPISIATGRGTLINGLLFLALPLFMVALSGTVVTEMTEAGRANSAESAGAVIGSGLAVGMSAFFGFILGAIFIIIGLVLLLGGTRDVRVVEEK